MKQTRIQRPGKPRPRPEPDTRTPKGKPLPY